MSIETRAAQYGKLFGNWEIREFIGKGSLDEGSQGKTGVFRIIKSHEDFIDESALKVVTVIREEGCLAALTDEAYQEYQANKANLCDQAVNEVKLMKRLAGNPYVVSYQNWELCDWEEHGQFGCDLLIQMPMLVTLRELQEIEGYFSNEEIIRVGRDICKALIRCGEEGILHRDIKPDNIFLEPEKKENYMLGDFGISRIVENGLDGAITMVGTPNYAAPEQFFPGYDSRVDIYSLGLTLYELANHKHLPFREPGRSNIEAVNQRLSGGELPPPSQANPELAEIILKACAFNPEDRYQTAEEFLAALEVVPPPPPPPPKPIKLIIACAAVAILLGIAFTWGNFSKPSETEPPVQGTWWSIEDNVLTIHGTGSMDDYPYDYQPWDKQRLEIAKVVVEDGVTYIGEYAFYKLYNVTDIQISASVTSIGDSAFYGCQRLNEIIIPDSVTSIGDTAFGECKALQHITIPDSVQSIGSNAFGASGLLTVTLPNGIESIPHGMFSYCDALTSVVIPEGVLTIDEMAFDRCTSLTDVTIPSSVNSIGEFAFYGCDSLTKVYIPNHEAFVDRSAFGQNTIVGGVPVPVMYDDSAETNYEYYKVDLTSEQEALISNLPVDDLPKDAVETLGSVQLGQIWQDTLIPLASDPSHDITLYGVVNAEWLAEARQQGEEETWDTWNMPEPLIILRYGSDIVSQVCSWFTNVKYGVNPWVAVDDFDNDGKNEIAICTFDTSGTGTAHHALLIYDLESQQFFSPDVSGLDILVDSAWEENRITLRGGVYTLEVPVDDFVAETEDMHPITYGPIIDYTYNEYGDKNQRIQCETSLSYGYEGYYFVDATAPIIFSDGQYKLGDVSSMIYSWRS